jgi:4-hydroxy-3-methylbut-2-enyl diphosphate reductase
VRDLDWNMFGASRALASRRARRPEVIVEEVMVRSPSVAVHVETVSAAEENEFFPLPRSLRPDAAGNRDGGLH